MKIEIGKTYTSNITDFQSPLGEPDAKEVWEILCETPDGMFVGRCKKKRDPVGYIYRAFDKHGNDGYTNNGTTRRLLPNTKEVVRYMVAAHGHSNHFLSSSTHMLSGFLWKDKKDAENYALNIHSYMEPATSCSIAKVVFEVEES